MCLAVNYDELSTSMDKPLMVSWTAWHWMSCQEVCGIRLVWFDLWMPLTTYQVVERATMEIMRLDLFGFWICLRQSVIGNYQDVGRATMRFGNKFHCKQLTLVQLWIYILDLTKHNA